MYTFLCDRSLLAGLSQSVTVNTLTNPRTCSDWSRRHNQTIPDHKLALARQPPQKGHTKVSALALCVSQRSRSTQARHASMKFTTCSWFFALALSMMLCAKVKPPASFGCLTTHLTTARCPLALSSNRNGFYGTLH